MPIKFAISIPFTVFAISLFYIVSTFLPTCRAVAIDNRTPSDSIDLVPVGNPKPSLSSSDDNSSNDSDDSDENTRLSSGPDRLFAYPTLAYPYNTTHWSLELEVGVFGPHFIPAGFIKKQLKLFVGMSTKEEEAIATARLRSSWVTGRSGFKVPVDVSFGKDRFGKDIIMQDVLDLPSNQYGSSKDIMYVPNDIIDHFLRRGVTALSYNATGTIRVAKSSKSLIARVGEIKEDVDELLDFDNDDDDSDDERLDDHAAPTAFPNSVFLVPYNGVSVVSDIDVSFYDALAFIIYGLTYTLIIILNSRTPSKFRKFSAKPNSFTTHFVNLTNPPRALLIFTTNGNTRYRIHRSITFRALLINSCQLSTSFSSQRLRSRPVQFI